MWQSSSVTKDSRARSTSFHATVCCLTSTKAHSPWPVLWNEHSPRCVRGLLRLVRAQVHEAKQQGIDWRGVVDCLRAGYTPDLAVAARSGKAALSAPRATLLGSPPPSCRTEIARFMDDPDDEWENFNSMPAGSQTTGKTDPELKSAIASARVERKLLICRPSDQLHRARD